MKIISVNVFEGGRPLPQNHLFETEDKAKAYLARTIPDFDQNSFALGTFINTGAGMIRADEADAEGDIPFEE